MTPPQDSPAPPSASNRRPSRRGWVAVPLLLLAPALPAAIGLQDPITTLWCTEAWVAGVVVLCRGLGVAASFGTPRKGPLGTLALGIGAGVVLFPLGAVGYVVSSLLGGTPAPVPAPPGTAPRLALLAGMLAAAVIEELAFRRIALDALRARLGSTPGLVAGAVVFALFHGSPTLWPPNLLLGLGLGWLAAREGSLWPAILAHATYNGTGWLLFMATAAG